MRPACLALLCPLLAVGGADAAVGDPVSVAAAFDAIELPTAELDTHLRRLTGLDPLPGDGAVVISRSVLHPDLRRAERYVLDELAGTPGITVQTHCIDAVVELDGGPALAEGVCTIAAELPGLDPDRAPLILGAHLDSTAKASIPWDPYVDPAPGADDDASGVSAILVLAKALAARGGFARTVRFVLFTAEEVGLQGSSAYVDALAESGEDVALMLQLDPVGYNGAGADRLWFAYDGRWPELPGFVDDAAEELGSWLSVQGVSEALIGGDDRSDHYPFWQAGMPALHFGAFPPPPDYHKTTDTMDGVDQAFLAEVTRVILRVTLGAIEPRELPRTQEPEEEPQGAGCGGAGASIARTPGPVGLSLAPLLPVALARRRRRAR